MKPVATPITLLLILITQNACLSTRQVQEGLVLIEQSKELPSENSIDAETGDKDDDKEVSEAGQTVQD